MQNTWKTIPLFFLVLICGAKLTLAQETGDAQQEDTMRKLQTRMDELEGPDGRNSV